MKVVLTDEAERDLEAIGDYIARATRFVDELITKAKDLADTPLGYPIVPRYERMGVRRRAHRSYLIFYRIGETGIDVLRILHGAQDYEASLFTEC